MRLQQPIHVSKPVQSIRLRLTTNDLPASAAVTITDVQLQPGEQPTGVVPNPREAGTFPGPAQYRNGVVMDGLEIAALANSDRAAPTRLEVRGTTENTRIGSYRFGKLRGTAIADGTRNTATQGHGRSPVITQRSDLALTAHTDQRVHMRLAWHDREGDTT